MSAVGSSALHAEAVTKRFPGVVALDAVTLEVRPGEVHGVVGENGAGKSTLMAVISGALVPDAGTVRIGGRALDPVTPQRARELGVAIVRQEPALMPDLSVAENMFIGIAPEARPPISRMRSGARDCLRAWDENVRIDVEARVDQLPPELRFIVEIARAFAADPAILILDEPTEHLSAEDVERLFAKIREHAERGRAIVYISHRIHEVKAAASRITVLRDGRGQGTHVAERLSESEIVSLIVGRSLEAAFPDKPAPPAEPLEPRLSLRDFRGVGFARVDLDVRPGEIVGLAGIEGNGQRETLRALAGLGRSHGTVKVDGRSVRLSSSPRAIRAGIAYLPGDRHREGIFTGLSVEENVVFRSLAEIDRGGVVTAAQTRARARDAIKGLAVRTPSLDTPIDSLSGGNQQKSILAGVIATNPKVLLIDEPTQGVDVGAKVEIYRILRELAARGTAIVIVSADALELEGLCDRVLVFSRGNVVSELTGGEVTEQAITSAALTATAERERAARQLPRAVRFLAGDSAPLLLIAVVVLALAAYTAGQDANYLGDFNISSTLLLVVPLAAVAMGQAVAMMSGGIDLSVGPLMGFLVVVSSFYLTAENTGAEQTMGWVLLIGLAAAVGVLNWALIEFIRLPPLVATLATYFALQAVSLLLRPTPGGTIDPAIVEGISEQVGPIPIAFVAIVVLGAALQFLLVRTRWGLALRATGSDDRIARVSGVRPRVARLGAYVACSLLAGVGAVLLLAQVGSGDPSAGTNYTLISISAAVIGGTSIFGGRGSMVGAVAGAILVQQVVSAIPFLSLSTQWESYLVGLMTLASVAIYSKARELTRVAHQ